MRKDDALPDELRENTRTNFPEAYEVTSDFRYLE